MPIFPNHIEPADHGLDLGTERVPWRRLWIEILSAAKRLTITSPVTAESTFNVQGALYAEGDFIVDGTSTFSGTLDMVGSMLTGARRQITRGTSASYSPGSSDSGKVYIAMGSSDTQTYSLPSAGTAGIYYTFICGHADGEILINPNGTDTISIFTFGAIGTDADTATVAPAGGTGIKNTAATNVIGDQVTLVSDGVSAWFGIGPAHGIWASQ